MLPPPTPSINNNKLKYPVNPNCVNEIFFFPDFCLQLFQKLKVERENDLQKIVPIQGDITEPELGISQADQRLLAETVSIVFHSAATVKFDEALKLSVTINMLGTKRLVHLCHSMMNLEVSRKFFCIHRECVSGFVWPPLARKEDEVESGTFKIFK